MEDSDRGRYVTKLVSQWICNDSAHANDALWCARRGDSSLELHLRDLLRYPEVNSAPWQVAQELALNDYNRIDWELIADELLGDLS